MGSMVIGLFLVPSRRLRMSCRMVFGLSGTGGSNGAGGGGDGVGGGGEGGLKHVVRSGRPEACGLVIDRVG